MLLLLCAAALAVDGHVLDADTREPIAGARVTVQAGAQPAWTDGDGAFSLDAEGDDLTIVGAAHGWFNGGLTVAGTDVGVEILLDRLPADAGPGYEVMPPEMCGSCHPDQVAQWETSPMSAADVNTWVYDLYDGSGTAGGSGGFVYTRDSRHAEDNPASECGSCHQPAVWLTEPWAALDGERAGHGVTCEACHLVLDVPEDKANYPGLYPGAVDLVRPEIDAPRVQLGLLDATWDTWEMRAGYQPQLEAQVCAACHQDRNDPDEDGDFEDGGFVSEPTYWEWRDSPYGDPESAEYASCLDCHMATSDESAACNREFTLDRTGQLRSHDIRGTTPEFLDGAGSLDVQAVQDGDELVVDVAVFNDRTGHHLPTGVTVRNVILLVDATVDGESLVFTGDQTVHDLGGVGDPAQGYYAGEPGKIFAKFIRDADGNGPTFFTDAAELVFDTRIAALDTDESTYRFAVPDADADVEVRARLIYRRAFRALVDAKGWTEDGHGNPLQDLVAPDFGHLVDEASVTVRTTAPEEPEEPRCGCSGGAPLVVLWWLPVLLARRRR